MLLIPMCSNQMHIIIYIFPLIHRSPEDFLSLHECERRHNRIKAHYYTDQSQFSFQEILYNAKVRQNYKCVIRGACVTMAIFTINLKFKIIYFI